MPEGDTFPILEHWHEDPELLPEATGRGACPSDPAHDGPGGRDERLSGESDPGCGTDTDGSADSDTGASKPSGWAGHADAATGAQQRRGASVADVWDGSSSDSSRESDSDLDGSSSGNVSDNSDTSLGSHNGSKEGSE